MNINIISVGKLKDNFYKESSGEYIKRLKAFCKVNIIEIPENILPENPSEKEIKNSLEKESHLIESKITGTPIALCIEGKEYSSIEFSRLISDYQINGKSTLDFIIGGSFGLSENIKSIADKKISMSHMTFPHTLARVMLLEQIYRSFTIINNKKYHK